MNGALVPLDILAKEINACNERADGYQQKAEDFRNTRDQKIYEAHERITGGEIHQSFKDWCTENIEISRSQVFKIVRRLGAPSIARDQGEVADGTTVFKVGDQVELVRDKLINGKDYPKPRKNLVQDLYNTIISTLTVDQMIELTKLLIIECNEAKLRRAQGVTLESVGNLMDHVDATTY